MYKMHHSHPKQFDLAAIIESSNDLSWKKALLSWSPTVNPTLLRSPLSHIPSATSMSFVCSQGWIPHFPEKHIPMYRFQWSLNICEISISDVSLLGLLQLLGQHSNAEFLWLPPVFLVALWEWCWMHNYSV